MALKSGNKILSKQAYGRLPGKPKATVMSCRDCDHTAVMELFIHAESVAGHEGVMARFMACPVCGKLQSFAGFDSPALEAARVKLNRAKAYYQKYVRESWARFKNGRVRAEAVDKEEKKYKQKEAAYQALYDQVQEGLTAIRQAYLLKAEIDA